MLFTSRSDHVKDIVIRNNPLALYSIQQMRLGVGAAEAVLRVARPLRPGPVRRGGDGQPARVPARRPHGARARRRRLAGRFIPIHDKTATYN